MSLKIWEPGTFVYDEGDQQRLYPIEATPDLADILYDKQIQQTSYIQANITDVFEKWFCSFFEPNYFKFIRTRTQSSYADFKSFMKLIYKKEKPFLVIDPQEIEHVEDSLFGQNMIGRYNMIDPEHDNIGAKLLYSIDIMKSEKFQLVYRRNRYRFNFDIMIMEQTMDRQINTYNMMMMNIRHNSKFLLPRALNHLLPLRHVRNIANFHGYDYKSDEFLNFLNQISSFPVIRRQITNGTYQFFIQQEQNIQVEIQGYPAKDNPELSDAIEWGARITDSFQFIVDLPTEFLFLTTKEYVTKFDKGISEDGKTATINAEYYADREWPTEIDGYTLTNRADIILQEGDQSKVNIISVIYSYNKSIYYTIQEFMDRGGTLSDLVKVRVYPNGSLLEIASSLNNKGILEIPTAIVDKMYTANVYVNLNLINTIKEGKNKEFIGTIEKY